MTWKTDMFQSFYLILEKKVKNSPEEWMCVKKRKIVPTCPIMRKTSFVDSVTKNMLDSVNYPGDEEKNLFRFDYKNRMVTQSSGKFRIRYVTPEEFDTTDIELELHPGIN